VGIAQISYSPPPLRTTTKNRRNFPRFVNLVVRIEGLTKNVVSPSSRSGSLREKEKVGREEGKLFQVECEVIVLVDGTVLLISVRGTEEE